MSSRVQKKESIFHLNLFDTIVLSIVVFLAGVVLYYNLSENARTTNGTYLMQYTVLLNDMREGTGDLVREGSELHDVLRNYNIGTVVSKDIRPAVGQLLDQENRIYINVDVPEKEDVYVVMEAMITDLGDELVVDGGYTIRVGEGLYLQGEGYMAAGQVVEIDRSAIEGSK